VVLTPCLLIENFHRFCSQWLCILIPQWIFTMSAQREFSWIFPSVVFVFPSLADIMSPQRELSRVLPSVVSFYFKSPTVLSSKWPFSFIFVMRECVNSWALTYKWFRLLAFDLWCLRATKSKEKYCRHPNLYRLILMFPGLSDDNLRSLIDNCVLKTT
jgi:hypothetical protein